MNILQSIRGTQQTDDGQTPFSAAQAQNTQQTLFTVLEGIPTAVYYWAGIGSIVASLALQLSNKKQGALFVGQWPPTFFILALLVKQLKPSRQS